MTVAKALPQDLIANLLADYKKPEDLIGENGLLKQITKALVERALEAEMEAHLGHGKNEPVANASGNTRNINLPRTVVTSVRRNHPFAFHGWVVLPDHLHCVIESPENDADFAIRWSLIKMKFSRSLPRTERLSAARGGAAMRNMAAKILGTPDSRRSGLPRAHGLCPYKSRKAWLGGDVSDWPFSTFHRLVAAGIYPADWGGGNAPDLEYDD